MKLSNETISVLKNFSTINQNLMVKAGKSIATMSAMKNIVAKAEVKEDFLTDFAIYDLNEFLSGLSLFDEPNLEFHNDFVIITEEGTSKSLKYWFSDPSVVTTPTKEITMPSIEITFNLTNNTLEEITKAAAVIGVPDMALVNGKLMVTDKKNSTANAYETSIDVGDVDADYKFWFKVENLKLMPGSYDVEISSKKITHFTNTKIGVQYWIALEPESTYTEKKDEKAEENA
jgi:hypothetical protein|tara:strand:+ start:390 stop:1082 length:693 start_codon:yes stop_codon:yes gene_type:complete